MIRVVCDAAVIQIEEALSEWADQIELIKLPSEQITASVLEGAHALITRSVTQVNESLLSQANQLEFVGTATIGVDHINQPYLESRQIKLASAAGCSQHAVAQYVIAVINLLRPHLLRAEPDTTKPVLGIVGYGHIGSTLARYAEVLGFDLLICDPFVASPHPQTHLTDLLSQSDVVSLHVPLTEQNDLDSPHPTHHLITERELSLLKPQSLLINSARGAVISESSILSALESGANFDAALDVFEFEPVISSALLHQLSLATPHIAGYSVQGKLNATRLVSAALGRHFALGESSQALDERFWLPADLSRFLPDWYDPRADEAALKGCLALGTVAADSGISPEQATDPARFERLRKQYALRTDWGYTHQASGALA